MFETFGVLIIFFFLLSIGILFYFNAQKTSIRQAQAEASQEYAFQLALKTLHLPELDCSFLNTQKENCIDAIKLEKLAQLLIIQPDILETYYTELGYSTIIVTTIYPLELGFTMYNNTPQQITDQYVHRNPILLYDATKNRYIFAVQEVTVYV